MTKNLPAIFEMNSNRVPISDYPINRKQPILDFNDVCYNTVSEFIDGFDQDAVRNSPGGRYCKDSIVKLTKDIGLNPCEWKIGVPVIRLRQKLFARGLFLNKGNPEKALKYCLKASEACGQEPGFCRSAYLMYKQVYDDKMPSLPRPYAENFSEKDDKSDQGDQGDQDKGKGDQDKGKGQGGQGQGQGKGDDNGVNCWVVGIVSGLLFLIFVFCIIYSINILTTAKNPKSR